MLHDQQAMMRMEMTSLNNITERRVPIFLYHSIHLDLESHTPSLRVSLLWEFTIVRAQYEVGHCSWFPFLLQRSTMLLDTPGKPSLLYVLYMHMDVHGVLRLWVYNTGVRL